MSPKTKVISPPVNPFWVIIGASAGGLDALKELLSDLDKSLPAIYLIAQHLDPKHPTILRDLLSRITDIPVELVDQDIVPKPNKIYIVSPGHNAVVEQGRIKLTPAAEIGPKPSVNLLLNSAAEGLGEKAIAVILSGTGSDGAQGVGAIKAAGGIVIAQTESTAKYSGMPNAAIDSGAVDLILDPENMAKELKGYIESSGTLLQKIAIPQAKTTLESIFQKLLDQTGYDFSGYKLKTIQRRIARRMAVHKLVVLEDYLTLLSSSITEVESLFKDLLISVTDFFRDSEAFADLEFVINQLVDNCEEGGHIRVWVPGCAGGEEPYSISILFHQSRQKYKKHVNFQIFATDIDENALSSARKGQFTVTQVKNLDPELLKQYFVEKDGIYSIYKSIRDQVVFARQNLVMDPPFSRLDLISCRNVLIYFSHELQKQVFQTFHFALKPNGYLFLGKSESATSCTPELFDVYKKRSQLFRRKKTSLSNQLDHVSSAASVARIRQSRDMGKPLMQNKNSIVDSLDQILLDQIVPTVVVVDESGHVMHIRGDVSRYLNFPQGRIDTNILTLIRDDIKVDVRALLQKAKRDGQASTQALFYKHDDAESALFIAIKRIAIEGIGAQGAFLISFTLVDLSEAFVSGTGLLSEDAHVSNENLRKEIAVFKERLQTSIEELETTNEELQSTNEELQSANEELQSANEELQTANEEMQSTNEELSTVNQELEVKTYELEQVNNDLENMLAKMNEVIVLVDNRLRVQRLTKLAREVLGLDKDVVGQTITTLGMQVDVPNLRQELLNVIETEKSVTLRVRRGSVVYHLRMVPYKSDLVKVVGVMMFFENTVHRSKLDPSIDCHITLKHLADYLPFTLISIDEIGVMTFVSPNIMELLGYDSKELLHQNVSVLMPEPYSSHHDGYLTDFIDGKTEGMMSQWRDVTALHQSGKRMLLKLRVEDTWINAERHFLGYLCLPEKLHECARL
ncbi:chemotaxis protein CheB [Thiomicrospira sp. ALE5]|uniref:chemotaxis protein CheB n=1 Tax=Thiomicrospira sp. ALE5 TaxID=748650 RepID=UPI0008E63BE3|nr:chemotaxis protein CheB [Thiomicrospira sp. ALE5]SFR58902.1 two-component system, chemotaxis family, CheB/CheR fusion protein [Thiomicrospira sp. ALE5]